MLTVAGKADIARARTALIAQVRRGAKAVTRTIGWPGKGEQKKNVTLFDRRADGFWAFFEDRPGHGRAIGRKRWQCWYGEDVGAGDKTLSDFFEVNIAVEQRQRYITGRVLVDETGRLYLAHKGELKGGRRGVVPLREFELLIRDFTKEEVLWSTGKTERVIVIGEIGAPDFIARLQKFISEAGRLRRLARVGGLQRSIGQLPGFKRGSVGKTKGHRSAEYDIERHHDGIVVALHAQLRNLGIESYSTEHEEMKPDLYTLKDNGTLDMLFEVKTGLDTSSIYSAIGQLVVYGAAQTVAPHRVLVSNGPIQDHNFKAALKHLDIRVLEYSMGDAGRVAFSGLERAIKR